MTVYILGYSTPGHFEPVSATLDFNEADTWVMLPTQFGENTMHVYKPIQFEV